MLADRSQPIFPEPKQANTRVETSTRERSLPSVVAFSSQRSLCLRNVLSSATNVVSVLIFSIDFTRHSKHCVSPPWRVSRLIWPRPSLIAPFRCPLSIALFISATRKKLSYENYTVARGEKEEEDGKKKEKKEEEKRKGEKRGSRRSVHASGNASCMPIVGRISRGT